MGGRNSTLIKNSFVSPSLGDIHFDCEVVCGLRFLGNIRESPYPFLKSSSWVVWPLTTEDNLLAYTVSSVCDNYQHNLRLIVCV